MLQQIFANRLTLEMSSLGMLVTTFALTALLACATNSAIAHEPTVVRTSNSELIVARAEYQTAVHAHQRFVQIDYPAQVRNLEASIKLARTELAGLERIEREYQSFHRFAVGNPFPVSLERVRYDRLEAKLRLEREQASLAAVKQTYAIRLAQLASDIRLAQSRLAELRLRMLRSAAH